MLFLRDTPSEIRRSTTCLSKRKQLQSEVLVDKAALKMASKAPPTRALADLGQIRIEQAAIWKSQPDFWNREKDTRTLKSGEANSGIWRRLNKSAIAAISMFTLPIKHNFFVGLSMSLDTAYTMMMNGRIMMMKSKRRSNQVDKGQNCHQTPFLILRFLRLAISQFSHRLSHILHLDNLETRAWC